jgi:hypothetical protein
MAAALTGAKMDGYGNDTTASDPNGGSTASALAQIFSTGVTAYVDSQAIQNGYQINNPQYYQAGYPAGAGVSYTPTSAGQGVAAGGMSTNTLLLIVAAAAVLFFALK